MTCTVGRGYAKSPTEGGVNPAAIPFTEWGANPAKDAIPLRWRKDTATYTKYPEYHMLSSPTKIKPSLWNLPNKLLSDNFSTVRMCTSNPADLCHLLLEPFKFFATFFAMAAMVCLSFPPQVIYPLTIFHFGNLLRSIVKSTTLDDIEMPSCFWILYCITEIYTCGEALVRSAVGEMKSIVPDTLENHRLTQVRQYFYTLTAPFGTYGMHYQAVSLDLESLPPKCEAYTLQDDANVEDSIRSYDGLKMFYEERKSVPREQVHSMTMPGSDSNDVSYSENNDFGSSYSDQVWKPSSRTFHALHRKSMPNAEYAHISDDCLDIVTSVLVAELSKMPLAYPDTQAQEDSILLEDSRSVANVKSQFDSALVSWEGILTWPFADTSTLEREKGKYDYGGTWKGNTYSTVTSEDGELTNIMTIGGNESSNKCTRVQSWPLQFTGSSNSRKGVSFHSKNKPSEMAEEHHCELNANELVYRKGSHKIDW